MLYNEGTKINNWEVSKKKYFLLVSMTEGK